MDGFHSPETSQLALLAAMLETTMVGLPNSELEAEARLTTFKMLRDGLEAHGLDVDSYIRYSLTAQLAGVLLSAVVLDEVRARDASSERIVDTDRWREALQLPRFSDPDFRSDSPQALAKEIQTRVHRARPTIDAWVRSAPLDDVIGFVPPEADELATYRLEVSDVPDSAIEGYSWIRQRLTQSDLEQWGFSSLVQEFRWQQGHMSGMFSDGMLQAGGPSIEGLTFEIARRVATPSNGDESTTDPLIWQMQDQAKSLLRQGRYAEASALFEFYFRTHPDSAIAQNNLGFCLIPVDPANALHHLAAAERSGFPHHVINIYNQCCCLMMLSREGEALDRAERYWQRERADIALGGYLWQREDEVWKMYSEADPDFALARLAEGIAQTLGRNDRAERWKARAAEISGRWASEAAAVGGSGTTSQE